MLGNPPQLKMLFQLVKFPFGPNTGPGAGMQPRTKENLSWSLHPRLGPARPTAAPGPFPAVTCPSCPFMSSSLPPGNVNFTKYSPHPHLPPGASGAREEDLNPQPRRCCLDLIDCPLVAKTGSAGEDLGRDLGEPSEGCLSALKFYFPPNSPRGCPHPRGSLEATSVSRLCPSFCRYRQGQRRVRGRWCHGQPTQGKQTCGLTRPFCGVTTHSDASWRLLSHLQFMNVPTEAGLHQQPAALRPAKMAPGFLLPTFPPRPLLTHDPECGGSTAGCPSSAPPRGLGVSRASTGGAGRGRAGGTREEEAVHRPHSWRVPTHQQCGVMAGGTDLGEGPWSQCTHPGAHSAVGSLVQVEYLKLAGRSVS